MIASRAELERMLREGSEVERSTALDLLEDRELLGIDGIFAVVMRDPSWRVRSQAKAALFKLPADRWRARWEP